jgi:hypothetical protein
VDRSGRRPTPARRSTMQIVESVAAVVAPLTVVTALLGYVGWVRSREYFGYFGLSSALVSSSPQDYILRSADVSFGSILLLTLAGVILLMLDLVIKYVVGRASGSCATWLRWGIAGLGVALILTVLARAVTEATVAVMPPIVDAATLALGAAILLRFGAWARSCVAVNRGPASTRRRGIMPPPPFAQPRLLPPAIITLAVVTLLLAAFWAATVYARDIGRGAAEAVDRDPRSLAVVTVYSREPIDFPGSNISAERTFKEDQQWNYRYTGARLLLYSNNRWFLIPEPRSAPYRSSVTVLRDTEAIRVEVAVPD